MGRFVEEADRSQLCFLPEWLDDWIDDENPVHVVDAFEALDLAGLGFGGVTPAATGLYIYGHLNRVQSSRRLEREAGRNIELMWLLGRLVPDHAQIEENIERYLQQPDSADRQEPSEAIAAKCTRLRDELAGLKTELERLAAHDGLMRDRPDQQISLTDPDARSMATSGRGSGVRYSASRTLSDGLTGQHASERHTF